MASSSKQQSAIVPAMFRLLAAATVCGLVCSSPAAAPHFWEPLEPGKHAVGFRLIAEKDETRPALPPAAGSGRQIPIAVWYPATASSNQPLRLRDYVVAGEEAMLGQPAKEAQAVIDAFVRPAAEARVAQSDLDRLLDSRLTAVRDAPADSARFPLILFAHASPETECVMAEYLASHGYVVVAVRSRAANDVAYKLTLANLDAMVADHAFAAARMQREANVSADVLGVIGMSNGSIAAVALQLKGAKVGAAVSLDGGIGEDAGGTYLKERSQGDVAKFAAPILHLYAPDNPHLNLEHLRSYNSCERMLVFVRGMRHGDFLAYPMFDRVAPRFSGEGAVADALPGFVWVNQYTLRFLDAHLRNDHASAEWLAAAPESHEAPPGLLTIEQLKKS